MLTVTNWVHELGSAISDPNVGISIAKISGDDSFSLYVTKIPPRGKVGAHFHQDGQEMYLIESGHGKIYTAPSTNRNNISSKEVHSSDTFTIPQGHIHQLMNMSFTEPLVLLFGCPPSHLSADREVCCDLF